MSTNSSVTVKHSDGKYWGSYGHWDGYFDGVGMMLHEHYNSQDLAEALVKLGDFSCLYESMDKPPGHSYDTPAEKYSVFYNRDRGEDWDNTQPNIADTFEEAFKMQGYDYLWDGKQWMVLYNLDESDIWMTVPEAVEKDRLEE